MEEIMVTIPMGRLEQLLDIETRAHLLGEYTQNEKYSISREVVGHYLGFEPITHATPTKEE